MRLRDSRTRSSSSSFVTPLERLTAICLAHPGATREMKNGHAAFLVRKRTFAWFLNNHHGDGMVSVACKALPGENAALAAAHPERFYMPPYVGSKGWVGLRLDTRRVEWEEVADLVTVSYRQITGKRK